MSSFAQIVVVLIVLLTKIIPSLTEPYEIKSILNKPGLLYQNLGHARISQDKFTLLSFVNISIYEQKLKLAQKIYESTIPVCASGFRKAVNISHKKIELESCSEETLVDCEFNFQILNRKFDYICHSTGHNLATSNENYRSKSAADDAQYYFDSIDKICNDNNRMHQLMEQQLHISSDAIHDYNNTAQSVIHNQNILNTRIETLNKFSQSTIEQINSLSFQDTVLTQFNLLIRLINQLHEEFDVIISSILFSKENIFDPSIITPRQLKTELSKTKISSILDFPFDNDNIDNMYKYFDICLLEVVYINNVLIFAIKIPLVSKDFYQMFNIIPLPIQSCNYSIYTYIDPSFPYLLLSTNYLYYGQLKDLTKCKYTPGMYICTHLTTHLIRELPTCETDLKTKQMITFPKTCNTRFIKSEAEIWHPLNKNQWLFVVTHPTSGTMDCETSNTVTDIDIQGTGILTLAPSCRLYTLNTVLTSSSNQTANYSVYIPAIDITVDECCTRQQEILQSEEMEPIKLSNLNLNELHHAENKTKQFSDELQEKFDHPFDLSYIKKWYNSLFGIVTIALIVAFTCLCCCRHFRLPMLSIVRRLFAWTSDTCQYLVCINSHNTLNNSRLQVEQADDDARVTYRRHIPPDIENNPLYGTILSPIPNDADGTSEQSSTSHTPVDPI